MHDVSDAFQPIPGVPVQIVLQCESANSRPFEFVGLYRSALR